MKVFTGSSLEGGHLLMNYLDLLQWPAMLVTILSAWLVAAQTKRKREMGFWFFLVSNVLWIIWGVYAKAYALIVLQIALAFLNIRGVYKNENHNT
ncbi:MAG: YgjV family protein [Pseudomonadota bacterium]